MSLELTFLAFKKSCTSCPLGEGVGIIWTKSKRTAAFFREPFPNIKDILKKAMFGPWFSKLVLAEGSYRLCPLTIL